MILQELFTEPLAERVHDIVYHATSLYNAVKIIKTGEFLLSSALGAEYEQSLQPPGHPYFFSTTRSRAGSYHSRYVSSGQVVFKLDGSWFNNRYQSGPVDYWGSEASSKGQSEQEDRVFSRKPTIPADNILEAHVYMSVRNPRQLDGPLLRKFLIQCKQKGLPVWVYDNSEAWIAQNKSRALSFQEILPLTQGEPEPQITRRSRNWFAPWLELWYKTSTDQLSDRARKEKYDLVRTNWIRDQIQRLSIDLSNERKPNSSGYQHAVRLIDLMTRNKLSVKEFVLKVKLKWEIIDLAKRHGVSVDQATRAVQSGARVELDQARGDQYLAQGLAINNLSYDIDHYNDAQPLTESAGPGEVLADFLRFACAELSLKQLPNIEFVSGLKHSDTEHPTFGYFDTETDQIRIGVSGRHPLDIMRTLAHELVHYKQRISDQLNPQSGNTGSDAENQANAQAGIIMRRFADQNPDYFGLQEQQMNEIHLIPDLPGDSDRSDKYEFYKKLVTDHTQDRFDIDNITVYHTHRPDDGKTFRLIGQLDDNSIVLVIVFVETRIMGQPALTPISTWVSRTVARRNLAARVYVEASRRYNCMIVSDDMQTSQGALIWTKGLPKLGIRPVAYEMGFGLAPSTDPYNSPDDDVRWIFDANRKITSKTFRQGRVAADDEENF